MKYPKYPQGFDGQWYEIVRRRGFRLRCCDCGLVHIFNFRIRKKKIQFQAWRDNRATGQIRRHMKKGGDV
jgi:hypothetical protein